MTRFSGIRRAGGLLLFVICLLVGPPRPAEAAAVITLELPQTGDRRVELRWNRAVGDTFERVVKPGTSGEIVTEREVCKELCEGCCRERRFGGYQVWRSLSSNPNQFMLLRTYSVMDSTWSFDGAERVFVDPDSVITRGCGGNPDLVTDDCDPLTGKAVPPFNGFFYRYAITWFESSVDTIGGQPRLLEFPMQTVEEGAFPDKVQPGPLPESRSPLLGRVHVVPNPFDPSDRFGKAAFGSEQRIQFVNLPSPATVRIFTVAGDLIRELVNDDDDGAVDWNLKNADGEDVLGGVYFFVAESGGDQRRRGHFVIIR